MVARILIWNLFDSQRTIEELRSHLPELPYGDVWIFNRAQDRFGLVSYSDELPDVRFLTDLIGAAPDVAEEFDVLE